jgi:tRNA modifying enzyme MnmG/GidA C-terminal domain
MLSHPHIRSADFKNVIPGLRTINPRILARLDIDGMLPYSTRYFMTPNSLFTGRYVAHLRRQNADVRLFLADESLLLQPALDYAQVTGLSSEERERLARARPLSIVSVLNLSVPLFLVTSAAGRRKTNGRDNTEGRRRATAPRKENLCGAIGTCRHGLSAYPVLLEG